MNEVPKMISTKDLSYIEDMINWNFTYCKKSNMYLSMIVNEDVLKFIEGVNKMHKKHILALIKIIGE